MTLTEMLEKKGRQEGRQEGREEGLEEGLEMGGVKMILTLVEEGMLSAELGCERLRAMLRHEGAPRSVIQAALRKLRAKI